MKLKDTDPRICIKSIKGEKTQKVLKRELSFLYATGRHDLFYINMEYHQNILNGFQVIERTLKCLRTDEIKKTSAKYIEETLEIREAQTLST